jgi:phosphoglycolate phosphatase-like HAD superfamily hydrolase
MNLKKYKTIVFDCDGVLLNSNKIKSKAFYNVALPYGEKFAQALLTYHIKNGGISRYHKFEYFLNQIIPQKFDKPKLEELLRLYAVEVYDGLLKCEIAEKILEIRKAIKNKKWIVVSGGDQTELRDVFKIRKIHSLFDGGIFGSPQTKFEIIAHELMVDNIIKPALMLGDSRLDHEVASNFDFDFVFVSKWTEFEEWKTYVSDNKIKTFATVKNALKAYPSLTD